MAQETKKSPRHVRERQPGALMRLDRKGLTRQGMALLLGAVFARAAVAEGMNPFGVAYVAAAGHPLGAAVGAFLFGVTEGLSALCRKGLVCNTLITKKKKANILYWMRLSSMDSPTG